MMKKAGPPRRGPGNRHKAETKKHKKRPGSGVIAPPPVRSGRNNEVELERF